MPDIGSESMEEQVRAKADEFQALVEAQGESPDPAGCEAMARATLAWETRGPFVLTAEQVQAKIEELEPVWATLAEILELTPDAEGLETAARALLEAEERDIRIWFERMFWGYLIHLNSGAVAALTGGTGAIAGALGIAAAACPPVAPILGLIAGALAIHAGQIAIAGAMDANGAVKLISAWICPLALIAWPEGDTGYHPSKIQMQAYTIDSSGMGRWSSPIATQFTTSQMKPAVAYFNGKTVLAYTKGGEGVYCAVYDPDNGWSNERQLYSGNQAGPALAEYRGKLYMVFSATTEGQLRYRTFDGYTWSQEGIISHAYSADSPALAVHQGLLYCASRGNVDDPSLWWTVFNGLNWSRHVNQYSIRMATGPALAVYQDQLHLVHRGNREDTGLWHAPFQPTANNSWGVDRPIPNAWSDTSPDLTVCNGLLYCVIRGNNDTNMYRGMYNGLGWTPFTAIGARSDTGPALITTAATNSIANAFGGILSFSKTA